MVKDKSHKMHQDFFHTVSQLSPEQLASVPDHYQFTPEQLPYWDQFDTVKLKGGPGSLFPLGLTHNTLGRSALCVLKHCCMGVCTG